MGRIKQFTEQWIYVLSFTALVVQSLIWIGRGTGTDEARFACGLVVVIGLLLAFALWMRGAGGGPAAGRPPRGDGPQVAAGRVLAFVLVFLAAVGTLLPVAQRPESVAQRRPEPPPGTVPPTTVSPTTVPAATVSPTTVPPTTVPPVEGPSTDPPTPSPAVVPLTPEDVVLYDDESLCGAYHGWDSGPVKIDGDTYEPGYYVMGTCNGGVVAKITYALSKRFRRFTTVIGVLDRAPKVAVNAELYLDGADVPHARRRITVGEPWEIDLKATGVVQVTIHLDLHEDLPSDDAVIGAAGGVGHP